MSDNPNPVSRLLAAMVGAILALRAGQAAAGGLTPEQEQQLETSTQELQALQAELTTDEGRLGTVEADERADAGGLVAIGVILNGDGTDANIGVLARLAKLESVAHEPVEVATRQDIENLAAHVDTVEKGAVDGIAAVRVDLGAVSGRMDVLEADANGLAADADAAGEKLAPPTTPPSAVIVTPNADLGPIAAGTLTVVTSDASGATVLTPVAPGSPGPGDGQISVAADGTPTATLDSGVTLGDSIPAPDGHPSVDDLAAAGHTVIATVPAQGDGSVA